MPICRLVRNFRIPKRTAQSQDCTNSWKTWNICMSYRMEGCFTDSTDQQKMIQTNTSSIQITNTDITIQNQSTKYNSKHFPLQLLHLNVEFRHVSAIYISHPLSHSLNGIGKLVWQLTHLGLVNINHKKWCLQIMGYSSYCLYIPSGRHHHHTIPHSLKFSRINFITYKTSRVPNFHQLASLLLLHVQNVLSP